MRHCSSLSTLSARGVVRRVGVLMLVLVVAPMLSAYAVFRTRGLLLDAAPY